MAMTSLDLEHNLFLLPCTWVSPLPLCSNSRTHGEGAFWWQKAESQGHAERPLSIFCEQGWLVKESHMGQSYVLLPQGGTSSHVSMGVKNDPPTDEEINNCEQKCNLDRLCFSELNFSKNELDSFSPFFSEIVAENWHVIFILLGSPLFHHIQNCRSPPYPLALLFISQTKWQVCAHSLGHGYYGNYCSESWMGLTESRCIGEILGASPNKRHCGKLCGDLALKELP